MQLIDRKRAGHIAVNAGTLFLTSLIIVACALFKPATASDEGATSSNDSKAQNKCGGITDARDWPNPYIVVNAKDIAVISRGSSVAQREMPLDQLAVFLKQLPKNAWPCGKVVAAQQNGITGPDDEPIIKENCAKLNKILKGLKVKVDWWPSA